MKDDDRILKKCQKTRPIHIYMYRRRFFTIFQDFFDYMDRWKLTILVKIENPIQTNTNSGFYRSRFSHTPNSKLLSKKPGFDPSFRSDLDPILDPIFDPFWSDFGSHFGSIFLDFWTSLFGGNPEIHNSIKSHPWKFQKRFDKNISLQNS
jgi:hypothetical protein